MCVAGAVFAAGVAVGWVRRRGVAPYEILASPLGDPAAGRIDAGIDILYPESSFFPDGEWWARVGEVCILLRIEHGKGQAAVATTQGDMMCSIELVGPQSLNLSGLRCDMVWRFDIPSEVDSVRGTFDRELRPPTGAIWRFVVYDVTGDEGALADGFLLYKYEYIKPEGSARILRTFKRLLECLNQRGH